MTIDPAKEKARADKKLATLKLKEDLPSPLLELISRTMKAQHQQRLDHPLPTVSPEGLNDEERVRQGAPLLERERFPVDRARATALFQDLLEMLKESDLPPLQEAAGLIRQEIEDGELDLNQAFDHFLAGEDSFFLEWARKTPEAPRAMSFLVTSCLSPGLESIAADLAQHLDEKQTWSFGHCPVCGSLPLMARLLNKEGARHLTCSFCHTEYRVKRLKCPFCDEENAGKLKYFKAEGESGYQVHVCDSCHMYIKTADFRDLDRPTHPLLDDLESLALDLLAQEQGYMRPSLSAWGF